MKVILAIILLEGCSGFLTRDSESAPLPGNAKAAHFDNRVDHFDLGSRETFRQRYWYVDEHWDSTQGPAVLFVQGEAPGDHFASRPVPLYLAKELKGILFALEHRFYGTSQPRNDWSLESLKLLNHHQAMADIANFIVTKTKEMGNIKRKWLLVGGSYAGALVVWFKSKYPHLADVVYSSSGVVNIIEDYKQYMKQVLLDISRDRECYRAVNSVVELAVFTVRRGSQQNKQELKAAMNASMLSDKDFLNYVTEIYLRDVQYSNCTGICGVLKKLLEEKNMLTRMKLYAELGKKLGPVPEDYELKKQRNTTINPKSSLRQWMYQVCSAYGWFATGDRTNPLRPQELDVPYFKEICRRVFDADLYPSEEHTNGVLGGLHVPPLMRRVVMANGRDDPWKWASYLGQGNDDLMVHVINCSDCSHCIDLHGTKSTDPRELREAREMIKKKIIGWMTDKEDASPKIFY